MDINQDITFDRNLFNFKGYRENVSAKKNWSEEKWEAARKRMLQYWMSNHQVTSRGAIYLLFKEKIHFCIRFRYHLYFW